MNPAEMVPFETVTLEKLKVATQRVIGATMAESLRLDYNEDLYTQGIVERLQGYVLAQKIADDHYTKPYSYQVHATAWEHVKDQYAPEWFKKRYPVKFNTISKEVTVHFERYASYPKANMSIPKGSPVFTMRLGGLEVIHDMVREA